MGFGGASDDLDEAYYAYWGQHPEKDPRRCRDCHGPFVWNGGRCDACTEKRKREREHRESGWDSSVELN